jgi:hypothetical protein
MTMSRMLALVLAIFLLFPCVSASDDLLSLESSLPQKSSSSKTLAHLAWLFESLQNFEVRGPSSFLVTLCFFGLTREVERNSCDRATPSSSGRAPPVCS